MPSNITLDQNYNIHDHNAKLKPNHIFRKYSSCSSSSSLTNENDVHCAECRTNTTLYIINHNQQNNIIHHNAILLLLLVVFIQLLIMFNNNNNYGFGGAVMAIGIDDANHNVEPYSSSSSTTSISSHNNYNKTNARQISSWWLPSKLKNTISKPYFMANVTQTPKASISTATGDNAAAAGLITMSGSSNGNTGSGGALHLGTFRRRRKQRRKQRLRHYQNGHRFPANVVGKLWLLSSANNHNNGSIAFHSNTPASTTAATTQHNQQAALSGTNQLSLSLLNHNHNKQNKHMPPASTTSTTTAQNTGNNYFILDNEPSSTSLSSTQYYPLAYQGLIDYWPYDHEQPYQHAHQYVHHHPQHQPDHLYGNDNFVFAPHQLVSSSELNDLSNAPSEMDPIPSQPLLLDWMHMDNQHMPQSMFTINSPYIPDGDETFYDHHHHHHHHHHHPNQHSPIPDETILFDETHSLLGHGHLDHHHHHHDHHHHGHHEQEMDDHHHLEHHPELLELEQEIEIASPASIQLAPVPPPTGHILAHDPALAHYQQQHHHHQYQPQEHVEPDGGSGDGNGDWGTLTTMQTIQPAAKEMLMFDGDQSSASDENHFYTPFKVNPVNVYSRYLLQDDDHDSDHDDDDDDDKCSSKGSKSHLTGKDVEDAVNDGVAGMRSYARAIQEDADETNRREPFIPAGVLDSKIFEFTTLNLKRDKCLSKLDVITLLPKINPKKISNHYDMPACQLEDKIICEPKAKFRSIDGSCNNLKMKTWGKSFTCHRRLIPPDYADGVSVPRQSYSGKALPNARELSSQLLPDIDIADDRLTSMTMAFGQFIIHDVARTLPTANDIRCCPSKEADHPECFAIDIVRSDDVLRKQFNQTCINFVRTVVCNPCALGPREQQNQATQTFDMSQMYGLRLNDSLALRTLQGGKLRGSLTSSYPKEEIPPKMTREDPGCNVRPKPPRFKCFETADGIRASQHPALQSLHTAFHRRHNQHADNLAKINPHWSDEKLYQEARHLMIAEVSAIIYGQYLPAIFGRRLMKHFRLDLKHYGYTKYDPKLNPATIQEFIVAAGRFGHSQINRQFRVLFNDYKMSYSYMLRDNFFETTIVSLGQSGGILKGLASDATRASDPYFVDDVKNSLYHLRRERLGRDLPAFNIQRGRDHGIPGYVYYLDFCFGHKVKHWNDLAVFIPKKYLKKLRLFYKHWTDIDLFVGGVMERLLHGAAFGPTFGCINGIQFYNFKYGDRFYFEHGYQSGSFSPEQLQHIRKVSSLSGLVCKTHSDVDQMPLNPFVRSSPHHNPMLPCFQFKDFDYSLWKDDKHKHKHSNSKQHRKHSHSYTYSSMPAGPEQSPSLFITQHHTGGPDNYAPPSSSSSSSSESKGDTPIANSKSSNAKTATMPPATNSSSNPNSKPAIGYSRKYHFQYGNGSQNGAMESTVHSKSNQITGSNNDHRKNSLWHPPMSIVGKHYHHHDHHFHHSPLLDTATASINSNFLLF